MLYCCSTLSHFRLLTLSSLNVVWDRGEWAFIAVARNVNSKLLLNMKITWHFFYHCIICWFRTPDPSGLIHVWRTTSVCVRVCVCEREGLPLHLVLFPLYIQNTAVNNCKRNIRIGWMNQVREVMMTIRKSSAALISACHVHHCPLHTCRFAVVIACKGTQY